MPVTPDAVIGTLQRHVLVDGFDLVLDTARSHGSTLVDARTGTEYLDLLTFFGSLPLGMNHPRMAGDARFMASLAQAALHKVTNSDIYTAEYAEFTETFARVLGDPDLPHLFFIEGGALAVENALKTAFDWKARKLGLPTGSGLSVMHLTGAFHGRSGYTLSLTNAGDESVTALYPGWDWPRVSTPARDDPAQIAAALRAAREFFERDGRRIACFIAEPVQGAGGDVHLGAEFLLGMQELCHAYDALFVLDEVQSGCGMSGTPWLYQQFGLAPDVVAFGKKTQACGIMAGRRVGDVAANVFVVPSRIGSTWGGNLTDMVRATRILRIIEEEDLIAAAERNGKLLLELLSSLAGQYPGMVADPRGHGLMCAFDLPNREIRDEMLRRLRTGKQVLLLPGGERAIRFRPSLAVTPEELAHGVRAVAAVLAEMGEN
jgi:L-lysine 6-transaminase